VCVRSTRPRSRRCWRKGRQRLDVAGMCGPPRGSRRSSSRPLACARRAILPVPWCAVRVGVRANRSRKPVTATRRRVRTGKPNAGTREKNPGRETTHRVDRCVGVFPAATGGTNLRATRATPRGVGHADAGGNAGDAVSRLLVHRARGRARCAPAGGHDPWHTPHPVGWGHDPSRSGSHGQARSRGSHLYASRTRAWIGASVPSARRRVDSAHTPRTHEPAPVISLIVRANWCEPKNGSDIAKPFFVRVSPMRACIFRSFARIQ
jgi:hypothetical protein